MSESGVGSELRTTWAEVNECPRVVMRNIGLQPAVGPHVVVFANEKGGVGKSTLALHTSVGLCLTGEKVAVLDLDSRQQSLAGALASREATSRSLGVELPSPRFTVLEHQSGPMLVQEISRVGADARFVIIDLAGRDATVASYAIGLADTIVTPVNNSFVDVDALAAFDPVKMRVKEPNRFANLVKDLRRERQRCDMPSNNWFVVKNRLRTAERKQQKIVDTALSDLARTLGFSIARGLSERVAYRELFMFGLTHLDLKLIPGLTRTNQNIESEVRGLISDLALDRPKPALEPIHLVRETRPCFKAAESYRKSLFGAT